ncbi:hypothetical protein ACFLQ8_03215, partial [Candidatus Auribacterota bacterium]
MLMLIKIVGVIIICFGLTFLINPAAIKKFIAYFEEGKRMYSIAVIRLILGVIFLLSASDCRLVGVMIVLGILFLIGGISIFALGLDKCRSVVKWYQGKSDLVLRIISIF